MTIFVKLPPKSGHLTLTTEKFFKARRCPLFRGFNVLSYKGKVEETTLKLLRNTLKAVIPANNACIIIYKGKKVALKFNIKDKESKKHKYH